MGYLRSGCNGIKGHCNRYGEYDENTGFTHALFVLYDALCHHGVGNFHESGYIGTAYIVDVSVGGFAVVDALLVYGVHDAVEFFIYFGSAP